MSFGVFILLSAQDQQPMELPEGKPVLIFVFNIMNPSQAKKTDNFSVMKNWYKNSLMLCLAGICREVSRCTFK